MQYTVVLTREEDGRYSVEVPSLPGVATYGNDLAHALAMAKDAVECYIDHSPPVERHVEDPAFRRERGTGRPTKRDRRQLDRLRRDSN